MKFRSGLAVVAVALFMAALTGCQSGGGSTPSVAVTLQPSAVTMGTGSSRTFTASVIGSTNMAVTWSATGGVFTSKQMSGSKSIATYVAPARPGTYTVTATSVASPSSSASATVKVTASGVVLSLQPSAVPGGVLQEGQQQTFTATVTGNSNTSVQFSATGGTFNNPNANSVIYTAPTAPGTYTVTVTSQADLTQTQSVTFTVPGIAVTINPTQQTIPVNQSISFSSSVTGATNTGITYSVTGLNGTLPSGATIDQNGQFTATQAGTYQVSATSQADNHTAATTTVTVKTVVTVIPPVANLLQGASQQFTATVTGSGNQGVTWSIRDSQGNPTTSGGTLNSVSANPVTYTAPATAGIYQLVATSQLDGSSGVASIVVPASVLRVTPPSVSVPINGTVNISASVSGSVKTGVSYVITDTQGNAVTTGGTLSSSSGGTTTYTAPGSPGSYVLVVSSPGVSTPTLIPITVTPPVGSGIVNIE